MPDQFFKCSISIWKFWCFKKRNMCDIIILHLLSSIIPFIFYPLFYPTSSLSDIITLLLPCYYTRIYHRYTLPYWNTNSNYQYCSVLTSFGARCLVCQNVFRSAVFLFGSFIVKKGICVILKLLHLVSQFFITIMIINHVSNVFLESKVSLRLEAIRFKRTAIL